MKFNRGQSRQQSQHLLDRDDKSLVKKDLSKANLTSGSAKGTDSGDKKKVDFVAHREASLLSLFMRDRLGNSTRAIEAHHELKTRRENQSG